MKAYTNLEQQDWTILLYNVIHHQSDHHTQSDYFLTASRPSDLIVPPPHEKTMPRKVDEGRLVLAIQTTKTPQLLSLRRAAQIYEVPFSILYDCLFGCQPRAGRRDKYRLLTKSEEEELIQYVIDMDLRGFPPRIDYIRDMANRFRTIYDMLSVGKH